MSTKLLAGVAALALCPAAAMAIGLDRSGQPVDILFEEGNYFELSFGRVFPSIDGTDLAVFGGRDTGDIGEDYTQFGAGVKFQVTDKLSFALIAEKPYGAELTYDDATATSGSVALGGSRVDLNSREIMALARYEFTPNYSVHGGLRYVTFESNVTLEGAAYSGLSGYNADFEEDGDFGAVIGAAYERPELGLRVALTYFQGTEHELDTVETVPTALQTVFGLPPTVSSVTDTETPDAINLDFQTGLNARTLLFGQLRYAWYGDVQSAPPVFDAASDPTIPGTSLTNIEDKYRIELGIGRAFSERLSGSVSVAFEPKDSDDLASPLGPTNGQKSISLGMSYDVNDAVTLGGGISYVSLGDARAETGTPDTARATFDDNHVVGIGLQLGYNF